MKKIKKEKSKKEKRKRNKIIKDWFWSFLTSG